MKISERCACGASIEVEDRYQSAVLECVKEWRANHNHIVRNPTYPYVTWGQGGAVGGYAPVYTTNTGTVSTHTCDEGDDGKCETCGRDIDGYE